MAQQATQFFGTQARILITEWKALVKLIVAHSMPSKDKPITNIEELESFDIENLENLTFSTADELPHTLSEKNLQTALAGPFGAMIKAKMAAYAKIARLRLEMHLNKEELFKNRRAAVPEQEKIPVKTLEKMSFQQLDQLQNDLDELTEQHHEEWRQFIDEWTDKLLESFMESRLTLTEREMKELKDEDIAPELLPRFIEVGLKLPAKDYTQLDFTDYLSLKAMLTVQSALSRQHLPHSETEIQNKLQNFKSAFTQMRKQEQQLLQEQSKLTTAILL